MTTQGYSSCVGPLPYLGTVQHMSTYCAGYWPYGLLCSTYTCTCTPEPTSFHSIFVAPISSHLISSSTPRPTSLPNSLHRVSAVMDGEPSYTVYIRLPFPRGDFVDPPPVSDPTLCRHVPSPC